jgi:DNA invertase Pin-like site-specific DNA recombinase
MAVIGYARVSTIDQHPELQHDALAAVGCERVFTDHASGAADARPQLEACLDYLRAGDTLVVWKLDRLGRSVTHLVHLADDLHARGVELVITTLGIDTRTSAGRLIYSMLGAVAEFERDLIRERTLAGLAAARARGRRGGRRPKLSPAQIRRAREMAAERLPDGRHAWTMAEIAREFRVGSSTLYRAFRQA